MRGLALTVLLATMPLPALAEGLSGSQLEQELAGRTWSWKSEKFEMSGVSTYYRDGTLSVTIEGWGDRPERGKWRIDGDRICTKIGNNSESCTSGIRKTDEKTLFSETSRTTFVLQN